MAKELKIRITGDASGLKQATDDGEGILAGFGKKIGAFSVATGNLLADGIKTGFSVVGGLIGDSIGGASDMAETISKVGVLFGDAAKGVEDFASNSAVQFGQTKQQALDAAATFATFGRAAGLGGEDLAKFSTDFVGLSSDLASFNNTSPEQAIEAIGAALRGESEPMRAYGVLLDDATLRQKALELGIVSTTKDALTPQQKVLAAQQAIWEQTGAAQGDFARTSDGLANKQRILAAQFTNLKTSIGQAFLPIVLDVVTVFTNKVLPVLQKFGPLIGGKIADAIFVFKTGLEGAGGQLKGFEGIMLNAGRSIRALYGWVRNLIDVFQAGGWQAALGEAGAKLKDLYLGYLDWLYTTALPAIGGFLMVLGRKLGTWVMETAWPYLQANLPVWLGMFGDWFTGTALPWLGEKVGILAGILGGWIGQAAGYLRDNLPGWLDTFAEWYTGTALPWVLEKMGELAVQLGEWIKQGAAYLRDNLPIWLGDFAEWFTGTALPWLIERGDELANKLADWVTDSAVYLLRNLPGWITKFEGWVRNDALPAMAKFGLDAAIAIKDALIGGMNFMGELGGQIVDGLISGLWSNAGRLASEVQSFIASTIPGPVRDLLGLGGGGGSLASMTSQRASGSSFVTQSLTPVDLSGGSQYQAASITVPVSIDGKQVALATAPYSRQLARART